MQDERKFLADQICYVVYYLFTDVLIWIFYYQEHLRVSSKPSEFVTKMQNTHTSICIVSMFCALLKLSPINCSQPTLDLSTHRFGFDVGCLTFSLTTYVERTWVDANRVLLLWNRRNCFVCFLVSFIRILALSMRSPFWGYTIIVQSFKLAVTQLWL